MSPAAQLFRDAVRHQRAGALGEADALYRQILAEQPDNVDVLTNMGVLSSAAGRYDEALTHYQRARALAPQDPDVLCNIANLHRARDRYADAESAYRAALQQSPGHVVAAGNLIELLLRDGRAVEAGSVAQDALIANPAANEIRVRLAALLYAADILPEARALADEAVRREPRNVRALNLLGRLCLAMGDRQGAESHTRAATAIDPTFGRAWHYLAVLLDDRGDAAAAEAAYKKAIECNAGQTALRDYGSFLRNKRPDEARALLEKACALDPNDWEAATSLGNLLYASRHHAQALPHFLRAFDLCPGVFEPAYNVALTLDWVGRTAEAQKILEKVVVAHPNRANAIAALGYMQYRRGLCAEALANYDKAVALTPNDPVIVGQRARALLELGRPLDALGPIESVLQRNPDDLYALKVYAQVLSALGRHAEAIRAGQRAMQLTTADHANTASVMAGVFERAHRREEAVRAYDIVRCANPDDTHAIRRTLDLKLTLCDWRDYDGLIADVVQTIDRSVRHKTVLPFCVQDLQNLPLTWPQLSAAAHRRAEEVEASVRTARAAAGFRFDERLADWRATQGTAAQRRIRVGYALPYTFLHSFPMLLKSITERHDRSRFEVFGYSIKPGDSAFDRLYRATFEHFRDLPSAAPEIAAKMIFDDQVDVLIDVTGHTGINCQEIMAMRPAPVSMHMLGYGITSGSSYIDYLLTDKVWMRPQFRPHCSENMVYMPDSWFIGFHAPRSDRTFTRAELGLPDDGFVFCNFNQPFKFEPTIFATWMRILKRVPGSVLWLGAWDDAVQRNLRREAEAHGVAPERLVISEIALPADHAVRLSLADLAVDSRYHAGGATSVDALWAGVPLVTCPGDLPTSNNGRSLLTAHGVPELITGTFQEYEDLAVALATDPVRYRAIRAKVEANRATAALFNRERYTRHLERAIEMVWDNTVRGMKEDTFVPD